MVEGCAPLTEADKNSVMGCATRYAVEDKPSTGQWVPRDTFNVDRNEQYQESNSIVTIMYSGKLVKGQNQLLKRRGNISKTVKSFRKQDSI